MDVLQVAVSDGALVLFSAMGLAATAAAIVRDTQSQRAEPNRVRVES